MKTAIDIEKEHLLLKKAKENKDNFGSLYKYFIDDVYRFTYSILNNKHDAEDITSQTFIKLYENLNKLEEKDTSLKSWLFTVSRNLCYSKFKKPTEVEFDEKYQISEEVEISFVDEIMNKDLVNKIQAEIKTLTPIEQETITLRIWEGMQFDEIAEIQQAKLSTVKLRFYRSIEKLKKSVEEKNYMRGIALPMLFTGIKDVSSLPSYHASAQLIAAGAQILTQTTMTTTFLTTISQFLATKAGIAVATGVTAVTIAGAGTGVYVATQQNAKVENDSKKVVVTVEPTKEPTGTFIPTQTVTPTPVNPYAGWIKYDSSKDAQSGAVFGSNQIIMNYPSTWAVNPPREGCGPVFTSSDKVNQGGYFTLCQFNFNKDLNSDINSAYNSDLNSPGTTVIKPVYSLTINGKPAAAYETKVTSGSNTYIQRMYYVSVGTSSEYIYVSSSFNYTNDSNLNQLNDTLDLMINSLTVN